MPFLLNPKSRLRGIRIASLVLTAVFATAFGARAASSINDGFNPNPDGIVNKIVVQPDGKILMAGYFTVLTAADGTQSSHPHIARINPDGSADATFKANASDVVRALVLLSNGQIAIGGAFTAVNGEARSYVAILNADGTLDETFAPTLDGVVYAIAEQADGSLILGGSFITVSGLSRSHVVRIPRSGPNAGKADPTFDPDTNRTVLSLAVQPNGQIVIGGGFTTLTANGAYTSTRNCIARVNSDGSLDQTFDPEANGAVSSIVLLPSGQMLLGGQFTSLQPNGNLGATQVDFLARLNADGSLDTSFIVNPLAAVNAIAVQSDGKVLIGGTFSQIDPQNSTSSAQIVFAARVNTDGSLDPTFAPTPNQAVNAIAVQQDGNILLGGYFTSLVSVFSNAPTPRNYIARVASDGSVDATMSPDAVGGVRASIQLANGQFVIGGTFLSVGGTTQRFLARINANGSLDTTFAPNLNGSVATIVQQSDGKLLVGGSFTYVDGIQRSYLARINPDGSLDGPFNPNPDGTIALLALQSNGQILVSGNFSSFVPNGATVGVGINAFARLNTDGTVDTTFVPNPAGGPVYAIAVQSDGKIVIGGEFASVGGISRGYIARILSSGALDSASFNPECDAPVYALAIQTDGKILAGGTFNAVAPMTGVANTGNTTFTDAGNNTVTIPTKQGQNVTTPIYINHLARFDTDGSLDATFFPDPSATVLSLAVQSDGKILVGGVYTSFAQNGATTGVIRNYIARIGTDGTLDATFNPNANAQVDTTSILSNGTILIGGDFTTLQPIGAAAPLAASHFAILNADGSLDAAFTAGANTPANGQVNALALQPNGQYLVGGTFGPLAGSSSYYFMRCNPDGSFDPSYLVNVDGAVNSICVEPNGASTAAPTSYAVWLNSGGSVKYTFNAASNGVISAAVQQPDGKVILGGVFTDFAGNANATNLVRINTDGTVDTTFNPTPNGQISAIALQTDGKILIGGSFSAIGSVPYTDLARLNADGTLDSTFNPSPNGQVTSLAVQADGKVLAGGYFTNVETASTTAITARNAMARFNADGTLDTAFNPDLNGPPLSIVVLSNAQILIGGSFTAVLPNATGTAVARNGIARLNSDGTVDTGFNPNPNSPVNTIVLQPDGRYLVGGNFSSFIPNPVINSTTGAITGTTYTAPYIARINTDGSIDTSFTPTPNSSVTSIALQSNGQLVVGGNFTGFDPNSGSVITAREFVARLNADGTVDDSFDPGLNSGVNVVSVLQDESILVVGNFTTIQSGGAVLIGGAFAHVGGGQAYNLARLNADSTLDTTFVSNPDGPVFAVAPQALGGFVVGGSFANVNGVGEPNLFRMNDAGILDTTFNPAPNGPVVAVAEQANGSLVVGGSFTQIGGKAVTSLARLSATGAPDAGFAPAINGNINAVVVQANGQIVIGGYFTTVDGQSVTNIARLNADGSIDASFKPTLNGAVQAITRQVDGSYYVGGAFTTVDGQSVPYLAHLYAAGNLDASFVAGPNAAVNAIAVQQDGKVIFGGSFTRADGYNRYEIARMSAPSPVLDSITLSADQSTVTWTQSGSAPALAAAKFEETTDGSHWTPIGHATAVNDSTWVLTGAPVESSSPFVIRATGVTASSENSSTGLIQVVQIVNVLATPTIDSPAKANAVSGSPFSFNVTTQYAATLYSASGLPAGLSINATTGVISGTPTGAGTYTVAITASNAAGSAVSNLTLVVTNSFTPAVTSAANRLLNISSRSELGATQTLISGFVVSGSSTKHVLVRAVGPGLAGFGVTSPMATPELQIYQSGANGTSTLLESNTGWGGGAGLAATFTQVGAFPLQPTSADAAFVIDLAPGAYTLHVFDASGKGGTVLAEVYDASSTPLTDPVRLSNISTRGSTSTGAGALIGGFVVSGSSTKSVLIRGIGPGLLAFGVSDAIPDPVLTVFDVNGNVVAENAGWTVQGSAGSDQPLIIAQDITNADASVGAFALFPEDADAALIANLTPGSYTFQVTSASGSTGEALGEVYELP